MIDHASTPPSEAAGPLILVGAGGHGAEIADYCGWMAAHAGGKPFLAGVVDEGNVSTPIPGLPFLGNLEGLSAYCRANPDVTIRYITALGNNANRRQLVERLESLRIPNLVAGLLAHPQALVGSGVAVGAGTCLAPYALVTTRARIGRHCILNVKASVSHDCSVGDYCNLNPGATICGDVTLGDECYVGAGATVIEKISVGPRTVIGAGAVVIRDLPADVTAVGVPARIVRTRRDA